MTHSELKKLLYYDKDSGVFTWRANNGGRSKIGGIAGRINSRGYKHIGINGKRYLAHRLAWFYVHGYYPEHCVDHINRDPGDNRIENLREVTQQCNIRNAAARSDNKSGIRGICWDKKGEKWLVQIGVGNKTRYAGRFTEFHEAVCTRLAAEQCLGWSECNSEKSQAHNYVCKMIKD